MASMEMVHYTETSRDQVERDLYEKPEIHHERRHGLDIHVYYLRKLGGVSMALLLGEDEDRYCREFTIPRGKDGKIPVNDAIDHPELYAAEAGLPRHK